MGIDANGSPVTYRVEIPTGKRSAQTFAQRAIRDCFETIGVEVEVSSELSKQGTALTVQIPGDRDYNAHSLRHALNGIHNKIGGFSIKSIASRGFGSPGDSGSEQGWKQLYEEVQVQLDEKVADLDERDRTLSSLTKSVQEMQTIVDRKTDRVAQLEDQIKRMQPQSFSSGLDALLNGYVSQSASLVLDVDIDWRSLVDDGHSDYFLKSRDSVNDGHLAYVSRVCGRKFDTEAQFNEWVQEMEQTTHWEDTARGQELLKQKSQELIHQNLLTQAESDGASEEVLSTLRKYASGADAKIKDEKDIYEQEAREYERIRGSQEKYGRFRRIAEQSRKRERSSVLPVVLHRDAGVDMYVPSVEVNSSFEEHLRDVLGTGLLSIGHYSLGVLNDSHEGFLKVPVQSSYSGKSRSGDEFEDIISHTHELEQHLRNDDVMKALGVVPKLITLKE